MAWRTGTLGVLAVAVFSVGPRPLRAQGASACGDEPAFHPLDFWIGEWSVIDSAGFRQGHNRIEAVLGGCAISESRTSAAGGEGRSLFRVDPATKAWKQVWVTGAALTPGGTQEKTRIRRFGDGATWRTTFAAFHVPVPVRGGPELPWPRPSPRSTIPPSWEPGSGP